MKSETDESAFRAHLVALRLPSAVAYESWCSERGLRSRAQKSSLERRREREIAEAERFQGALKAARKLERRPEEVILLALTGKLDAAMTHRAELVTIAACARQRPKVAHEPLMGLLLLAQRRRFLLADTVVGRYGAGPGNTLIGGLFALTRLAPQWVRPLSEWKPDCAAPHRQFASLARHLLAHWSVPAFLDGVFFEPDASRVHVKQQVGWWRHVAKGLSLRTAPELPLTLTRRMAHLIHTEAPSNLTPQEALRWGQARGLGMGERQARALIATPLGESFTDEPFWESFVQLIAATPLMDPSQIGPLYDYLQFERRNPPQPGERDRLPVGFTLKGRSVGALLTRMEAWHVQTTRVAQVRRSRWEPSGRGGLAVTDGAWSWQICELTTAQELSAEGRAMRHCVGSYADSCARGGISIWSVQALGPPTVGWLNIMTVAVSRQGQITEARGWCNALPSADMKGSYVRLASDEQAVLLRARKYVQRWAAQERLNLPGYLSAVS